ncbi:uncharacterized protein LOC118278943 isoform X4 [Spodoptera frugiperda]|uniref:Uncharacterized protein LOC118278943 isoform X4 n=1 Tax=Spodoptera frugiperda TaxID=7108 RepID=A0A9R0F429_SPOFR|nr:uncharacterized protein LOC118278943 isoform X4 [Spodoptera frugiperda]
MPSCVIRYCNNYTGKTSKSRGITYHSFPTNEQKCTQWVDIVRKQRNEEFWQPSKASKICSIHFKVEDKYMSGKGYALLKKSAIPVLEMFGSSPSAYIPTQLFYDQDSSSNSLIDEPTSRHERRVSSPEEYFHTQDSSSDSLIDDPPIEDLKNYHQHKLINQEPRLKPTASFRRVTPNKSVNSPALLKLLLQDTSTTNKQLKSKYEDTIMPSTSSYSTLPMTSEEKHEASADKIRCPKCSTEIETKQYVQLPLDALICQPCFLLLDTEAGEHERLLGHTMVCVGCGKSVRRIKQYHNVNMECPLLAVLISQNTYYVPSRNNYVCHMCWIRANRQAVVDSTHDMQELASDNMQDLASNNNAAAPPDVQEDRVNAILVNVYKYFATEGTELSPSQLRERTALCTGASEADVECALVLHQEVSATQKPLRKPPRKRRKKESKSPPPIQEEEPYIERETLIVTVDPKAGDANSEINPLAIKEEQPSSPITCEQDASLCEPQQSGLKPEDMAKVFVKTEPTEEPNS